MLDRDECFVEVKTKDGKRESIDVLDLDEESFRRWIITMLVERRVPTVIRPEGYNPNLIKPTDSRPLTTKP